MNDYRVVDLILPEELPTPPLSAPNRALEQPFAQPIPVLNMQLADEGQFCARVHLYLAGEGGRQYKDCPSYMASGGCTRRGRLPCPTCKCVRPARNTCQACEGSGLGERKPCVFLEDDDAPIWRAAQHWRLLEERDGSYCIVLASTAFAIASDLGARVVGAIPQES